MFCSQTREKTLLKPEDSAETGTAGNSFSLLAQLTSPFGLKTFQEGCLGFSHVMWVEVLRIPGG